MIESEILVTGGSGMVGRELSQLLPGAQYPSSQALNLLSEASITDYFARNKVSCVVHLAAHVGSLHDNIENRVAYFDRNVVMNTLLTRIAATRGVRKFLGVLSTCIYPDIVPRYPITEDQLHEGCPHADLLSYAYAKRAHAVQLDAYRESRGLEYSYVIPSNMFGVIREGHEGRGHFVNDLIRKIIHAKRCKTGEIELFGDGTPLRQFMLARDFASVILELIAAERHLPNMNVAPPYNLTINEMAELGVKLSGGGIDIKYNDAKPNGQYRKDVDTAIFNAFLPDFTFTPFREALQSVLEFYESQ